MPGARRESGCTHNAKSRLRTFTKTNASRTSRPKPRARRLKDCTCAGERLDAHNRVPLHTFAFGKAKVHGRGSPTPAKQKHEGSSLLRATSAAHKALPHRCGMDLHLPLSFHHVALDPAPGAACTLLELLRVGNGR